MEKPRFFLRVIAGLVVFLLLWAAIAPIDKVVRVEGKVIPAGRSQQIQHLEGGVIASINTAEGVAVKRGDLLMTIDNTSAGSTLSETESKLNSYKVKVRRLEAETQNVDELVFPPQDASSAVAKAEIELFIANRNKLKDSISVHQSAIGQKTAEIQEATQRQSRLQAELQTAHQRLVMEQTMAAHGATSKIEVLEAQGREQRLHTELDEAIGQVPKLNAAIAEDQSRIDSAKADYMAQAHTDLVATLAEIDRLSQTVAAAQDRLNRTEVRATSDGVINHIAVNTVGGVVKPGENLIELIPYTNELLIESRAVPRDRGYLRNGLDATVRISAYDAAELGLLKGVVTQVGADSIPDSRGELYYQVNVLVKTLPESYEGHPIVPGMTATVDIVTGRRRILSYLLSPISKFTYTMFRDPR